MKIEKADCQNLDRALSLEWLETNGRGGFSSGTVAGANTRRYHALLLVARKPPADRLVLVNHLDEWIDCDGRSIPLSTNLYPGAVHPSGYAACTEFSSAPWPKWRFDCGGAVIQRDIFCVPGRDLVIVRWKLASAKDCSVLLRVRPMLSGREYHLIHHENGSLSTNASIEPARVVWQPYSDVPPVQAVHSGTYRHEPDWYRRIQFPVERQRGLDCEEDWWSPGEFQFELKPGKDQTLVLTSEAVERVNAAALAKREATRRERSSRTGRTADPLAGALQQAAGAYLSERGDGQTVIAGYPWFTDWGRDAFIALPGLCLVTGQHETAWRIIESFSAHVSEGMVPNRFPDAGEEPEYNTIDASLWFIHAIGRYLTYSHDEARVLVTAWPAVKEIINGYRRGTRYNIQMDQDGLIAGGASGMQLTWMDAKVGDWVVTPRQGKAVEIQALWIRSLEVGADLAARSGDAAYAARCREDRARAIQSFRTKFWHGEGGYLYDVIDGPGGSDASIRPNQLFALSLCDELVTTEQAASIIHVVHEHLLTPVGLRTLSPKDSRYRPHYDGGVVERDGAYHQGTVWPFLLGPFITAWLAVSGKTAKTKTQARSFLNGLEAHLGEACVGQVSEIFDGDAPHHPRGCPAQAWSVAEPLRAMIEDLGVSITPNTTRLRRITIRSKKETKSPAVSDAKKPKARKRPR